MKGQKLLFIASWVLLLIMSVATVLLSLDSLAIAYSGRQDVFGGTTIEQMRNLGGDDLVKALRARRTTAAVWSLACSILSGWMVLVPYRRGERWAWWALLVSLGLPHFISLARVALIGTTLGAGASATVIAFLLLGLLAGTPRMFEARGLPELKASGSK